MESKLRHKEPISEADTQTEQTCGGWVGGRSVRQTLRHGNRMGLGVVCGWGSGFGVKRCKGLHQEWTKPWSYYRAQGTTFNIL